MRQGGAQVPEEVSLVLRTRRETLCSWFWHKPLLPASAPKVPFLAFSKAALFRRRENCYGASGNRSLCHLVPPWDHRTRLPPVPRGQVLKVTPESRRYTGLTCFSKQDEAKLISCHPGQPIPRWRRRQRGQWLFPNPAAIQVCINDLSKGCGCKLLKQMQSSDNCKELVSLAKKNYKTPVFQKKQVCAACL